MGEDPSAREPRAGEQEAAEIRSAKPDELEAVAVHRRLAGFIEGSDPLARDALKKALERATEAARSYAAFLMNDGAKSDAAAAKAMRCSTAEVVTSRDELNARGAEGYGTNALMSRCTKPAA
jgi:hypothetical protein